jgi:exosortase A-associated hydrolase 1
MKTEIPIVFNCWQAELLGIVHTPESKKNTLGVLIVVGGAQYRIGSHRQFILMARKLSEQGVFVMRFDQRGTGDSGGDFKGFEQIDNDIETAIDAFLQQCPHLSGVVIWGLCDAASAALLYAHKDDRVKGLVLLNPWVHTEQGEAKAYLKHYYLQRVTSLGFWAKVFSFKFNYRQSLFSLVDLFCKLFSGQKKEASEIDKNVKKIDPNMALPERMRACLKQFQYPVLFILSGRDLTADQFRDAVNPDRQWQQLLAEKRVSKHELLEADHTFSSATWRNQVAQWTFDWLVEIESAKQ